MLQKIRTMPGKSKRTAREVPGAYKLRSKILPLKLEKALWKIGSKFGKSTLVPVRIANKCGVNFLSCCSMRACLLTMGGGGPPDASNQTTTFEFLAFLSVEP